MGNNTEIKIMRVSLQVFEELKQKNLKHNKTFKVKKDEQVNKVYFVYLDEEENLHFIGNHSVVGFIDRTALMREISAEDKSQINEQLVSLIDREIDSIPVQNSKKVTNVSKFAIFGTLLAILAGVPLSLAWGVGIYFVFQLAIPLLIVLTLATMFVLIVSQMQIIRMVDLYFNTSNTHNMLDVGALLVLGMLAGAGLGILAGLVVPGIGVLIGAAIGAAVGLSIFLSLSVIDYIRKRADNPEAIQKITDLCPLNESLGTPVNERKFPNIESGLYYGNYIGQYNKLFPSIKNKEREENEKTYGDTIKFANL